jgi:hypothetical protein
MRRIVLILAMSLWSSGAAVPQDRELHWRNISVDARLDADGRLHVVERQDMVFTGDWNGGERRFDLGLRQNLRFEKLKRIDRSGEEIELFRSDLSRTDQYDWSDSDTLRWRSRLPTDPVFDRTEITYVLEYALANILFPEGNGYVLDHDFLFADREGPIEKYEIRLTLDAPWRTEQEIPQGVSGAALPPGRGHVLSLPLSYSAPGRPAAVWHGAEPWQRYGLAVCLLLAVLYLYRTLFRREKSLGRFAPLLPVSAIDESWLQKTVLSLPPEVVGAAWDEATAAPEVAAVLARLVAEGKLQSEIRRKKGFLSSRDVLHLTLLVDRSLLSGYEKNLIDALFFAGSSTDTDSIREHYKQKGFDPAGWIREPLKEQVRRLGGEGRTAPRPTWKTTLPIAVLGLGLLAYSGYRTLDELIIVAGAFLVGVNIYIWAMVLAYGWRGEVDRLPLKSWAFSSLLVVLITALMVFMVGGFFRPAFWTFAGLTVLGIALVKSVLNMAKSRQGADKIRFRKNLASAREFFRQELDKSNPGLRDEWFPYLLAFGLGSDVDRWFKAFGGSSAHSRTSTGMGFGSSGSASSGRWSGGGGAFGGAGASASWAAAAGAMAAGVTSSSSRSGGGGGGGRSGGGGGGGW